MDLCVECVESNCYVPFDPRVDFCQMMLNVIPILIYLSKTVIQIL